MVQASPNNGIITLPNGEKSVDAKDVPKDQRLVVDQVTFSPNPVTSVNETIGVRIKVKDTRGNVVRNAIVFIRSTPKVTSGGDHAPTATDGWVQYGLQPEKDFPVKNGYSVQFYVKAYRAIYDAVRCHELPAFRIRRRILLPLAALEQLLIQKRAG